MNKPRVIAHESAGVVGAMEEVRARRIIAISAAEIYDELPAPFNAPS